MSDLKPKCDPPCEGCPRIIHEWTWREIIPAIGVFGVAIVMLILVNFRLSALAETKQKEIDLNRQRWEQLLTKDLTQLKRQNSKLLRLVEPKDE